MQTEAETALRKLIPSQLHQLIQSVEYNQPEGTTLTVCVLKLHTGFVITGESMCSLNPEQFSKAVGEMEAKKQAFDKLLSFEIYRRLYELHKDSQ